ncbi:MAG: alpha/beta hydrolase [Spirulina sp. SIO3F2]|nr:alpha/beta hydrolase [Spirulina sp. SIO3F2]
MFLNQKYFGFSLLFAAYIGVSFNESVQAAEFIQFGTQTYLIEQLSSFAETGEETPIITTFITIKKPDSSLKEMQDSLNRKIDVDVERIDELTVKDLHPNDYDWLTGTFPGITDQELQDATRAIHRRGQDVTVINFIKSFPLETVTSQSALDELFSKSIKNQPKLTQDFNLVYNGDFSAGDIGFNSDYSSIGSHDLFPLPARYAVGKSPYDHHTLFGDFGDHTTGDGLMMIINGGSYPEEAGPLIWSQTLDVEPNTDYNLSAWIASAWYRSSAQLQFAIDSEGIGAILTVSTDMSGVWENLNATWNSGSSSSIEFSIINHNPIWNGSDFVVDDILFSSVANPESVPEPSAMLGILISSTVGILLKRRT